MQYSHEHRLYDCPAYEDARQQLFFDIVNYSQLTTNTVDTMISHQNMLQFKHVDDNPLSRVGVIDAVINFLTTCNLHKLFVFHPPTYGVNILSTHR